MSRRHLYSQPHCRITKSLFRFASAIYRSKRAICRRHKGYAFQNQRSRPPSQRHPCSMIYFWRFRCFRQFSQYARIRWDRRSLSSFEKRDRLLFWPFTRMDLATLVSETGFLPRPIRSSRVMAAISPSICFFLFSNESRASSNNLCRSLNMRCPFQ